MAVERKATRPPQRTATGRRGSPDKEAGWSVDHPFRAVEPTPATGVDATPTRLLDDYMTVEQLAAELGVTPLTVRRWQALKSGPPITRVGRKVFYRRPAVRAWLLKRESAV
jgi:Helix-turn-helix domain